ncbi:hypothetical protein [Streptomyces sp. NPDC058739]|uniref:hypothetical protein n=1 Tax=Streptomyces sp. NPDC058739 TaxID=3346618 RepID=UPI0036AE74C8
MAAERDPASDCRQQHPLRHPGLPPAPGATPSEEDLIAWCKEMMAGHKYPRQVEFFAALPTNATGKILKADLRDAAAASSSR